MITLMGSAVKGRIGLGISASVFVSITPVPLQYGRYELNYLSVFGAWRGISVGIFKLGRVRETYKKILATLPANCTNDVLVPALGLRAKNALSICLSRKI
jgi:hypothetical protein